MDFNEAKLTINGVKFDREKDFKAALYAISSNMIEGWEPTKEDIKKIKNRFTEN